VEEAKASGKLRLGSPEGGPWVEVGCGKRILTPLPSPDPFAFPPLPSLDAAKGPAEIGGDGCIVLKEVKYMEKFTNIGSCPLFFVLFVGHRVLLADALCVSMPDTPALAAEYGYPAGQKPGLGFPLAKLLVLLDLSTGLIRRVLINPYRTHEFSQARQLHPELQAGDILVGDRGFCSFVHLALLVGQACHGLFRAHQRLAWNWLTKDPRHAMQAQIVRLLGLDDRLMIYRKPKQCPTWMSAQDYAALPAAITVRELCYRISPKGFRSRQVMLVTTLLDPALYARKELARLYGLRWEIETQFRHLKCTLGMAILKGQTVAIIQREILAYVLVYNLVAREIRGAAARQKVAPDRISFIDAARWLLAGMKSGVTLTLNPLRPGRSEPRARKRRPITYPFMTRTREVMRKELSRNATKSPALT
jgi:hypothetical protein